MSVPHEVSSPTPGGAAGSVGGAGSVGTATEAVVPVPVDCEALRDLYKRRDRLAEKVAAVDREIKAQAALWAQERRMFGLGPDGVRRMLFQPY